MNMLKQQEHRYKLCSESFARKKSGFMPVLITFLAVTVVLLFAK
ncbi:hypothetical protein [Morganella psychrotolerans]|nr:hypothetical protein [Morganella psychrotolerans]